MNWVLLGVVWFPVTAATVFHLISPMTEQMIDPEVMEKMEPKREVGNKAVGGVEIENSAYNSRPT